MTKIITVTSGKGGVGKTNVSVNMAIHLARQGHRTCLFDADLGLANINILMGIYPENTLEDVINEKMELKDIIIHHESGIDIIPGSSGVAKMEALPTAQLTNLVGAFRHLEDYDYLIFDTSAGVSKNVIAFCMSASEVVLVITPEPTSLTDAYALMKILVLNGYKQTAKVVVNQSKNAKTAQLAYSKLKETVRKFLGVNLAPLGTIVADPRVIEAVAAQQPFVSLYPNTRASKCLKAIVGNLLDKKASSQEVFSLDTFWHRCFDVFTSPLKIPTKKKEAPPKPEPVVDEKAPIRKSGPTAPTATQQKSEAEPKQEDEGDRREDQKEAQAPSLPENDGNGQLMGLLIHKMSEVTKELSGIRKAIEQGGLNKSGQEDSYGKAAEKTVPLIPLDFESFLAEQNAKGGNGD